MTPSLRQRTRLALASVCAATLLNAGAAFAGKADDTLNIAFDSAPATLDAYKESDRPGLAVGRMLFNGLLQKNLETGKFDPAIASSYRFTDDTTIALTIRDDVKFHDGSLLTIDDVVYTLSLVSSKDYNARFPNQVAWIAGVEKTGDHTIKITMHKPYPLALEMLSENLPIYPRAYYEKDQSAMGAKPIGTGPYRMVESLPGSRYVMERFDDYFGEKPAIKRLVVRVLPDLNTQYAELLNGGLDWIWRVPPDVASRLAKQGKVDVKSSAIMRISYISINPGFDSGNTPLASQQVRQAINMAINREAIRKALVGGASSLINAACNPAQFGCSADVPVYGFDTAKAKALLADAGHANGFSVDLVVSAPPRAAMEVVAANLGEIGIKVNLVEQQYGTAMSNWREGKIALLFSNWGSYGIADAALSTSNFFRGGADDQAHNAEVAKLLTAADTTVDNATRLTNYAAAQKIIAEQAYWVPLWTHSLNAAQTKDLSFAVDGDEFPRFYKAHWQ